MSSMDHHRVLSMLGLLLLLGRLGYAREFTVNSHEQLVYASTQPVAENNPRDDYKSSWGDRNENGEKFESKGSSKSDTLWALPGHGHHHHRGQPLHRGGTKLPSNTRYITVSKQGNANYNSIQQAVDSIPDYNLQWVEISIAAGNYQWVLRDSSIVYLLLSLVDFWWCSLWSSSSLSLEGICKGFSSSLPESTAAEHLVSWSFWHFGLLLVWWFFGLSKDFFNNAGRRLWYHTPSRSCYYRVRGDPPLWLHTVKLPAKAELQTVPPSLFGLPTSWPETLAFRYNFFSTTVWILL